MAVTNPDVCRLLFEAGHGLDVTDKWGATPLMYAAAMGQVQTVKLLLSAGADPSLRSYPKGYKSSNRTFLHYAIARGHLDLVLEALGTIQQLCGDETLQNFSQLATMIAISTRQFPRGSRTSFFSELVKNLADVNMSFKDGPAGADDNNLMHYVLSVEEASALVHCGFNQFNSPNSDGRLAINSVARHCDPALIKFCLDNGTGVGNKDKEDRGILFDILCNFWGPAACKTRDTLAGIRVCLDAGVDIFEKDSCRCPCSPGGCTIFSIFSTDFPSTYSEYRPGLLWTLEWLTLVEEHRGAEAARQGLLLLLRRVKCTGSDIDITHTCCHRGRGICHRSWYHAVPPSPLTDEDITEIHDEQSEFIDILENEIRQLGSETLDCLWSKWMFAIKARFDANVVAVNKEKAKRKPQLQKVSGLRTIQGQM